MSETSTQYTVGTETLTDPAAPYRTSDATPQPVNPREQAHQQALRATESGALFTAIKAWTDASVAVDRINVEPFDLLGFQAARNHEDDLGAEFHAARRAYVRGHASMPEVQA